MKVFDSSLIEIFLVSSSFLLNDIIFRFFRSCIQFKCRYFRIWTSFNKNKNTYLSSQTPKCFTHPMSNCPVFLVWFLRKITLSSNKDLFQVFSNQVLAITNNFPESYVLQKPAIPYSNIIGTYIRRCKQVLGEFYCSSKEIIT